MGIVRRQTVISIQTQCWIERGILRGLSVLSLQLSSKHPHTYMFLLVLVFCMPTNNQTVDFDAVWFRHGRTSIRSHLRIYPTPLVFFLLLLFNFAASYICFYSSILCLFVFVLGLLETEWLMILKRHRSVLTRIEGLRAKRLASRIGLRVRNEITSPFLSYRIFGHFF